MREKRADAAGLEDVSVGDERLGDAVFGGEPDHGEVGGPMTHAADNGVVDAIGGACAASADDAQTYASGAGACGAVSVLKGGECNGQYECAGVDDSFVGLTLTAAEPSAGGWSGSRTSPAGGERSEDASAANALASEGWTVQDGTGEIRAREIAVGNGNEGIAVTTEESGSPAVSRPAAPMTSNVDSAEAAGQDAAWSSAPDGLGETKGLSETLAASPRSEKAVVVEAQQGGDKPLDACAVELPAVSLAEEDPFAAFGDEGDAFAFDAFAGDAFGGMPSDSGVDNWTTHGAEGACSGMGREKRADAAGLEDVSVGDEQLGDAVFGGEPDHGEVGGPMTHAADNGVVDAIGGACAASADDAQTYASGAGACGAVSVLKGGECNGQYECAGVDDSFVGLTLTAAEPSAGGWSGSRTSPAGGERSEDASAANALASEGWTVQDGTGEIRAREIAVGNGNEGIAVTTEESGSPAVSRPAAPMTSNVDSAEAAGQDAAWSSAPDGLGETKGLSETLAASPRPEKAVVVEAQQGGDKPLDACAVELPAVSLAEEDPFAAFGDEGDAFAFDAFAGDAFGGMPSDSEVDNWTTHGAEGACSGMDGDFKSSLHDWASDGFGDAGFGHAGFGEDWDKCEPEVGSLTAQQVPVPVQDCVAQAKTHAGETGLRAALCNVFGGVAARRRVLADAKKTNSWRQRWGLSDGESEAHGTLVVGGAAAQRSPDAPDRAQDLLASDQQFGDGDEYGDDEFGDFEEPSVHVSPIAATPQPSARQACAGGGGHGVHAAWEAELVGGIDGVVGTECVGASADTSGLPRLVALRRVLLPQIHQDAQSLVMRVLIGSEASSAWPAADDRATGGEPSSAIASVWRSGTASQGAASRQWWPQGIPLDGQALGSESGRSVGLVSSLTPARLPSSLSPSQPLNSSQPLSPTVSFSKVGSLSPTGLSSLSPQSCRLDGPVLQVTSSVGHEAHQIEGAPRNHVPVGSFCEAGGADWASNDMSNGVSNRESEMPADCALAEVTGEEIAGQGSDAFTAGADWGDFDESCPSFPSFTDAGALDDINGHDESPVTVAQGAEDAHAQRSGSAADLVAVGVRPQRLGVEAEDARAILDLVRQGRWTDAALALPDLSFMTVPYLVSPVADQQS